MNIRIKLVIEYQETKSDLVFEEIVKEFNNLIKFHLKNINHKYIKDVRQEMLMSLYNLVNNRFKVNKNIKINDEFFKLENFKLLEKYHFDNVDKISNYPFVKKFINKYGTELIKESFYNEEKKKLFLLEYMLFCNENQFTYYLNKTLNTIKNNFFRNFATDNKYIVKSLNEESLENIELIDLKAYESLNSISIFDKYEMNDEDLEFILSFLDKGRKLSEKEVAAKYNISQQSVSKKLKKIKEKYKN